MGSAVSRNPQTTTELLQDLVARVRRLELARRVSVGPYVLRVDDEGRLVATHRTTGTVTVLAEP